MTELSISAVQLLQALQVRQAQFLLGSELEELWATAPQLTSRHRRDKLSREESRETVGKLWAAPWAASLP